ncbi:hypothetical protein SAMN04487785_105291 [Dyella jiangningensis]|uniref:hypothetical protein n=3 Tax=Gammaproteobacteria TaxID=1236 RepID=UPI000884AF2B|nr:hypothetical protein [Dyella sp. AtDHG13]PXV58150.1 hypothetical protein BDW41_10628 [Dyella sp. AtDHG13]SDK13886.1 hypothetical protein SAMN04487785_105291 [Dyella jiangningensis]
MRSTTRIAALGLAGVLLAACHHKDKDAPLAFVPADTPYVVANLDVLDDDTRKALLAQADAQLPSELTQLRSTADDMAEKDPDLSRLLKAVIAELDGKTIEQFAQNAGLNIKGRSAFYGLGLSPVARFELTDPKAFDAFVGRLEAAYGKPFDTATVGGQSYRKHVSADAGVQIVLAEVGKQAVAAMLPADAPEATLRLAFGLDRPEKNIQDDGRLDKLAKAKDYQPWAIGQVDLARLLPLAASGKDPLFNALIKARAETESAKTGEPVANQLQVSPACEADATRIASRVPAISFGYTKLDEKHQDIRWDVALADDITKAFSGMKVELPGLGAAGTAPFDISVALPIAQLRPFWSAQADAVAAKPFTCPSLNELNEGFTKIGLMSQQAAVPPVGDLLGVRVALDSFDAGSNDTLPKFSGRILIGTSNPAGLVAMAQMASSGLQQLKLTPDGKPVALPPELTAPLGAPVWAAMGPKSLALAVGQGEEVKMGELLNAAAGDAGRLGRLSLSGEMYQAWVKAMAQKAEHIAELTAEAQSDDPQAQATAKATAERSKAQFASMETQAARIKSLNGDLRMTSDGLVITSQTELK